MNDDLTKAGTPRKRAKGGGRPPKKEASGYVQLRVPAETKARWVRWCRAHGVTLSAMLVEAGDQTTAGLPVPPGAVPLAFPLEEGWDLLPPDEMPQEGDEATVEPRWEKVTVPSMWLIGGMRTGDVHFRRRRKA